MNYRVFFLCILGTISIVLLASCGTRQLDGMNEPAISYSTDVAPILNQKCVGCHGEVQPLAGLNLSSYTGIMSGARGNPVVILGKPNMSTLVTQVKSGKMPKYGEKLSDEQVDIVADWVTQGALDN